MEFLWFLKVNRIFFKVEIIVKLLKKGYAFGKAFHLVSTLYRLFFKFLKNFLTIQENYRKMAEKKQYSGKLKIRLIQFHLF